MNGAHYLLLLFDVHLNVLFEISGHPARRTLEIRRAHLRDAIVGEFNGAAEDSTGPVALVV
jgi:hypothetical protein